MAAQKDFVIDYMSLLPETWDDVKFIDGFPGKFVILARKKGKSWFIAGINGEMTERIVSLHMPFIEPKSQVTIITDGADNDLIKRNIKNSDEIIVTIKPYGGFVIKTK